MGTVTDEEELELQQQQQLTGEELQHGRGHGDGGRDVRELDDEGGQQLDHDVGHLHRAHGEGHHALLGTAVDETRLQALHQLPLHSRARQKKGDNN